MRFRMVMHLIRLIIVDESELLRVGLKMSLEAGEDIEVVGNFKPTGETVTAMQRLTPDVVLLNVSWPSGDGMSVCREIRDARPSMKVVMLSSSESEEEMVASMISERPGTSLREHPRPRSSAQCAVRHMEGRTSIVSWQTG